MSVAAFPLLRPVQNYIATPRKMLIDGQWQAAQSGKTFETINPATGEVLATVAEGTRPTSLACSCSTNPVRNVRRRAGLIPPFLVVG